MGTSQREYLRCVGESASVSVLCAVHRYVGVSPQHGAAAAADVLCTVHLRRVVQSACAQNCAAAAS
jgi:hypothetical protein